MPTRNGRNALAFTDSGPMRLRNQQHALDRQPLDPACPCLACRHSRGYLRHLFQANEMLGPMLVSIHNLTYYQRLLAEARHGNRRGPLRIIFGRATATAGNLARSRTTTMQQAAFDCTSVSIALVPNDASAYDD